MPPSIIPRIIGEADVHRDRRGPRQKEVIKVLDKGDLGMVGTWVVKLEFNFGEGKRNGTGFYVNLPCVENDVLVTAGHNLIDNKGIKAKDLTVVGDAKVGEECFRICEEYEQHPTQESAVYDYGVVLLPKDNSRPRDGFGLNLGFSSDEYLEGSVYVHGYPGTSGKPLASSGPIVAAGEQLSYKAPTEQGMSGSPVWAGYDGLAVVVAIHNTRPVKGELGSRGTQITEEVFRNICTWTGVGHFKKRLCVKSKPHNLYLSFSKYSNFAKVLLASSSSSALTTSFDIFPAYVAQTPARRLPLYAFMFHKPSDWDEPKRRWVQWQPKQEKVILVEDLLDINLVRIYDGPKKNRYYIVQVLKDANGKDEEIELRMDDQGRSPEDVEDGMDEVAGVSFGPYKEPQIKNRIFCFE